MLTRRATVNSGVGPPKTKWQGASRICLLRQGLARQGSPSVPPVSPPFAHPHGSPPWLSFPVCPLGSSWAPLLVGAAHLKHHFIQSRSCSSSVFSSAARLKCYISEVLLVPAFHTSYSICRRPFKRANESVKPTTGFSPRCYAVARCYTIGRMRFGSILDARRAVPWRRGRPPFCATPRVCVRGA